VNLELLTGVLGNKALKIEKMFCSAQPAGVLVHPTK
jgi:hypothetical protein